MVRASAVKAPNPMEIFSTLSADVCAVPGRSQSLRRGHLSLQGHPWARFCVCHLLSVYSFLQCFESLRDKTLQIVVGPLQNGYLNGNIFISYDRKRSTLRSGVEATQHLTVPLKSTIFFFCRMIQSSGELFLTSSFFVNYSTFTSELPPSPPLADSLWGGFLLAADR